MNRKLVLVLSVFLVQFPILICCIVGLIPLHPLVIMIPLVCFLNTKIENRDRKGLGLIINRLKSSILLALFFSTFLFVGRLIVFRLEGMIIEIPSFSTDTLWFLLKDFIVAVFIIAMWEEIVNRGYIQTRLQEVWRFKGVIVATLLFASLHIPSAFLDFGFNLNIVLWRFVETGLAGFMLAYVYWLTGSVFSTIAFHGLRNFSNDLALYLGNATHGQIIASQIPFQFVWLLVQIALLLFISRTIFKHYKKSNNH
ncbi:hypothetical protein AKJ36_02090 [candidate division MSBL1 archaeon SCGC-AAA259I07]|uniref:CAAX prenyl protease 2/Lysostaphin resistance protein A-like domain-containing protein n=1 Tax=candidate division MSBL1 archaeon SCGC-AAA259I07 TaxID=1698266 RepID=A0A133UKX5_9EURY|nr:hypothetical protein AKJ36_02090 [candidate division MSBL1 archaeon SCGC-AAA259I07]